MAKLYFYYSAMNAGKTTTLLQSSFNYRERGMNTILFTAQIDDRYGDPVITSRIGITAEANIFDSDTDMFTIVTEAIKNRPLHCVLVDEAQFLNKAQVFQLAAIADSLKIPVLCLRPQNRFSGQPV